MSKKRVIIVHGWGGNPKKDWLEWLKKELEEQKIIVIVPEMPDTDNPVIGKWTGHLKKVVGAVNKDTYFVGHSIGCQTIMRLLEKEKTAAGGCLLVAGWFHLMNLEEETEDIAAPWIKTPIDFATVKKNGGSIIALFSDDDPYVPVSDANLFKEHLDCETVIVKGRQHFNEKKELSILPFVEKLLS